eukprot:3550247-Alexandrium_andersonii.AAC.1
MAAHQEKCSLSEVSWCSSYEALAACCTRNIVELVLAVGSAAGGWRSPGWALAGCGCAGRQMSVL